MNNKTAIRSAQLQQLFSGSNASLTTTLVIATILAYMQRTTMSSTVVIAWFSAMVLVVLSRAVLVMAHQRSAANGDAATHAWLGRFRAGVIAAGLTWGAAGFLLFPVNHPQYEMFLIFMLAGVTAGGVVSYSADLTSAIVFSVLVITPATIRLFVAGDDLSKAMSLAGMLYLGFMIISLRHINRNINENITLRLEAASREESVRASEERYRLLLSHSPVGIFHYDTNLVITYCNNRFADIMLNSIGRLVGLDMKRLKDQTVLPALRKALEGKTGYYEGHYLATLNDVEIWVAMTCAPSRDGSGNIAGGIAIVEDITERKAAEEQIKTLAFYDHLTDLPNRRLLMDRLQHAMASSARSGKEGALLFIDLDNFKALNDTLGHDMGDLLLQQVAQRLISCVREDDSVARLGGDEFVVMLENLSEHPIETAEQTEVVGEKIIAILSQPYRLDTHEYRCTPSIGATLFNGHQQSKDELLKQADIAMYQAKKAGRNTLRFFDQQMQNAVNARVGLEGELRQALEKQQLHLYYQIQVDGMHRPMGAEALIRWIHPGRGLVLPEQFIHVAEETDLILPLGQWVLETACAQLQAWRQDALTRDLVLAVNVSANQFRRADFAAQVQATVQRYDIDPALLKLELTESMLLENIEDTIRIMAALKNTGIKFSLDDFGTGYSSLQYLKRLPLDQLKIDRSFVRDIATDSSDNAIVRAIIAMAQILNLEVIAEGVETEEQRQLLGDNGCSNYQGYLFGEPVPVDQFAAQLKQS